MGESVGEGVGELLGLADGLALGGVGGGTDLQKSSCVQGSKEQILSSPHTSRTV